MEKIAQGGMAEIFKGLTYDFSGLKKFIVNKRILPHIAANKDFIRMLVDEAKIAVRLSHGYIAQTYDLGKVADDYFIVMEYVEGKTLSQIFKKTVELKEFIPIPMAVFFISELSHGLDYIHRRVDESGDPLEIVHRDISPQNVIVSYSGNVKIVDFGVAKAAWKLSELESGVLKGKFAYMSPEQTEGLPIDSRSDIFSTGVVLWEILTGRRLCKKKSNSDTIEAVQKQTVYPPSAYRNEIPSELDEIVMRALDRKSDRRYQHATELALALTKFNLKHFPEFKAAQTGEHLERIFEDEDKTGDLYQEKTMREELTVRDPNRELAESEELLTSVEETMIVDPQELDFRSIFEEIDVEEGSDITRSIALAGGSASVSGLENLTRKDVGPEEEESTGDIPIQAPPPQKVPPISLKRERSAFPISKVLLALGVLLAVVGAIFANQFWFSKAPARLMLLVSPPDAQVTVDSAEFQGGSPYLLENLKPRRNYRIVARRSGYGAMEKDIFLYGGRTKIVDLRLSPRTTGLIQVTSKPPGAAIYLDGQATGKVTPDLLETDGLRFPVILGLSRGGPPQWQEKIQKAPAGTQSIHGDLTAEPGSLSVESSPSGASVSVEGKEIGATPIKNHPVPAERDIDVTLQMTGFISYQTSFRLKSGEKEKIYHAMQKEPSR